MRRCVAKKIGGAYRKGAVKVNGVVAKIGDSVDPKRDIITLNGKK